MTYDGINSQKLLSMTPNEVGKALVREKTEQGKYTYELDAVKLIRVIQLIQETLREFSVRLNNLEQDILRVRNGQDDNS